MNEEDAERGAVAVAIREVFILALLGKGLLDSAALRYALETARDGIGEHRPKLKRTASRVF